MWIVELICDLFPRSLNGDCVKLLSAGKPPAIVIAARFLYHRSWYQSGYNRTIPRGSSEQRYLRTPRRRQITMSQKDQTRCHPKFTDYGHPLAPSLTASALRETVSRTESSQELFPHQSPKREVTNQRTDFVLARPTQRCDMKHCKTKTPTPTARHSNNRPRRTELPAKRLFSGEAGNGVNKQSSLHQRNRNTFGRILGCMHLPAATSPRNHSHIPCVPKKTEVAEPQSQ